MVFVETSLFSRLLGSYLSDEEYRQLQNHLIERPDAGAVIKSSGGVDLKRVVKLLEELTNG